LAGSPLALLARSGLDAVLVIDAWHESHLPLARRYLELCERHMLDCRLSESGPAEPCEAERGEGCAAVARDYDAALIFQRGRLWRAVRARQRAP